MPVHIVGVDAESPMLGYLHVGDTIVRLGDIEVVSPQVLRDLLHDWPSSGSLRLTVIRDHHTLHVTAPLPPDRQLGMDLAHVPDRRSLDADRRGSAGDAPAGSGGTAKAAPPVITVADALTEAGSAASSVRALGGALALLLAAAGVVLVVIGVMGTCPDGTMSCPASFKGLNIGFVVFGAAIALSGGWLYVVARAIGARLRLAAALAQSSTSAGTTPQPSKSPGS